MRKTTRGGLAAAAAALLLVGGVGSLAYWSATDDITGPESIMSGQLALSEPTCEGWVFDDDEDIAGKPYEEGDLIVPGDVLSQSCQYTITATGEHLRATFGIAGADLTGDLAGALDVTATATVGGETVDEITEADNQSLLDVAISVEFLAESDNTTQSLGATLSSLTVALEQVHN